MFLAEGCFVGRRMGWGSRLGVNDAAVIEKVRSGFGSMGNPDEYEYIDESYRVNIPHTLLAVSL